MQEFWIELSDKAKPPIIVGRSPPVASSKMQSNFSIQWGRRRSGEKHDHQ
jgi:hypothetical protein